MAREPAERRALCGLISTTVSIPEKLHQDRKLQYDVDIEVAGLIPWQKMLT